MHNQILDYQPAQGFNLSATTQQFFRIDIGQTTKVKLRSMAICSTLYRLFLTGVVGRFFLF